MNLFLRKNVQYFEAVPPTYTKKLYKNLIILKKHMNDNCLSRIELGHGNDGNKHFHRPPNRTMLCGGSIISYELAEAVLTVLFFSIIIMKARKKSHINVVHQLTM